MITEHQPPRRAVTDLTSATGSDRSCMDCGGIFAGAVLALAVSFLLIGFGVSLGLSLTSPYRGEGGAAATLLIGVLAAMLAAVAGGKHRDEGLGFDAAFQRR